MDNRYSRQILFDSIGESGQEKLRNSIVTIIGCGALGSANAEMLVRAGVGKIHLVDREYVETLNLHRKQLFTEQDAEQMIPKVVAAERRLRAIRSDIEITPFFQNTNASIMEELAKRSDVLIDATDNFKTRLLINDAAFKYGRPWVYGACVGSTGVVFPFIPSKTACFRCLLPVLPSLNETCNIVGIISPAVQITAAMQSAEALKWLTENNHLMRTKVHHFDTWNNTHLDIDISCIKSCVCMTCGEQPSYPSLTSFSKQQFAVLHGRNAVQIIPGKDGFLSLDDAEIAGRRANSTIKRTPYLVQLSLEDHRLIVFGDGRLLIHGMQDINAARKLYLELFG